MPRVGAPLWVNTKPLSPPAVPDSTNTKVPPVSSDATFASSARVSTNAVEPSPAVVRL